MAQSISVFIMDVKNSTSLNNYDDLTSYLVLCSRQIKDWATDIININLKHRLGDEIILIGENYSTAYTIAFFTSLIWKFPKQPPYFGLSFGEIDKSIDEIDLDTWIHPVVKEARNANDHVKKNEDLGPILFGTKRMTDDLFDSIEIDDVNNIEDLRLIILSTIGKFNKSICQVLKHLTKRQKEIVLLYLMYGKQKDVAKSLSVSQPTISYHFKKTGIENLTDLFFSIQELMDLLQATNHLKRKEDIRNNTTALNHSIYNYLQGNSFNH